MIKEITVTKTIQEEQYEPLTVSLTSTVEEDDVENEFEYMKELAMYLLQGERNADMDKQR